MLNSVSVIVDKLLDIKETLRRKDSLLEFNCKKDPELYLMYLSK